jgi:hypothetical protein
MRAAFSKGIDQKQELRNKVFQDLSPEEIKNLPDSQYVGRVIATTYSSRSLNFDFAGPKYTIIGLVDEGNDRVHAVVRVETKTPNETTIQVTVIIAEKQNDKWKIAPSTVTIQHPVPIPPLPPELSPPPPAPPRKTP